MYIQIRVMHIQLLTIVNFTHIHEHANIETKKTKISCFNTKSNSIHIFVHVYDVDSYQTSYINL